MGEFRMPSLGADMDSGTVTRWLVKPGDTVHRGDVVAEVDTDKATIEVEVFEDGVVDAIVVPEGRQVPVGTVLATLRPVGDTVAAPEPVTAPPVAVPVGVATAPVLVARGAVVTNGAARTAPASATAAEVQVEEPAPPAGPTPVAATTVHAAAVTVDAAAVAAAPPQGASPLARRLGAVLGVDLRGVTGTGPGGVVTRADVQHAAAAATAAASPLTPAPAPAVAAAEVPAPPPAAAPVAPARAETAVEDRQAAMRRAIAALMARSKAEIPHYYLGTHIDMSRALAWLEDVNLERPVARRLAAPALLIKATALAAREFPEMNGFVVDGVFRPAGGVHVGVAVSLREGGLVAPCIHDADEKSLDELMSDLRGLVERARNGRLRSSEMSDPTLTVTNLGDQGVETVYGIIYAPQVALVGFGRIVERPWASGGMVGARPVVHATLSADHRVSDGHRGARFLAVIDRHLQEPETL